MTWYSRATSIPSRSCRPTSRRCAVLPQPGYLDFSIDSTQVSITPDKKTSTSPSASPKVKTPSPTSSWPARWSCPRPICSRCSSSRPGDTFSATASPPPPRPSPTGSATRICLRQRQRRARGGQGQARNSRLHLLRRSGPAGVCAQDQLRQQRPHPRRGAAPRDASDGRCLVRRRGHQPLKVRLDRLGYFEDVAIETPAVPGSTDQVDANFTVKERHRQPDAGRCGFLQRRKGHPSGSIAQQPVRHRQRRMTLQMNTSRINNHHCAVLHQPYWTMDGSASAGDIISVTSTPPRCRWPPTNRRLSAPACVWDNPIAEDDRINFGLAIDQTKIDVSTPARRPTSAS